MSEGCGLGRSRRARRQAPAAQRPNRLAAPRLQPSRRYVAPAAARGVPSPPTANPPGWTGGVAESPTRVADPTIAWCLPPIAAANGPGPRAGAPRRSLTRSAISERPDRPTPFLGPPVGHWQRPDRFAFARSLGAQAVCRRGARSWTTRHPAALLRAASAAARLRLS